MSFNKELGQKIRKIRHLENITQGQLAKLVGLRGYQSIQSYELGRVSPSLYVVGKLSEALDYDFFGFLSSLTNPNQQ